MATIDLEHADIADELSPHQPLSLAARLTFMLGLLVITLPFVIMVPWSLHGGRTVIAEVATVSEVALLAVVLPATSRLGRRPPPVEV
jgi:hypothetical protein